MCPSFGGNLVLKSIRLEYTIRLANLSGMGNTQVEMEILHLIVTLAEWQFYNDGRDGDTDGDLSKKVDVLL